MEFCIKSNALNSETREQIKSVLKSDDWVAAFLLLYKWLLVVDPSVVIRGEEGRGVSFYSAYMAQNIFYIKVDKNGDLQSASSLPMKSLDFTFWDALETVQNYHRDENDHPYEWLWNSEEHDLLENNDMKTGKSTNGENAAGLSSMNVSPQEMELLLKELVDKQVTHIKFGQGKITSLHDRTVKVAFDGESGEKAFVFPGAFGRFLKISDPKLQQRMNELFFSY